MTEQIEKLKQSYYTDQPTFDEAFGLVKKLIGSEIRGIKIIGVEPLYFSDGPIGINVEYLMDGKVDEFLFDELIHNIDHWDEIDDDSTWQYIELMLANMN